MITKDNVHVINTAMGKSSFIWGAYRNGATENEEHREAKLRIGNLLLSKGWSVKYEKEIEINKAWTAIADIYARHPERTRPLDCELLGASHKTTTQKWKKDQSRREALEALGNAVVEFEVLDVLGRWFTHKDDGSKHWFKLTDEELLRVIDAKTC